MGDCVSENQAIGAVGRMPGSFCAIRILERGGVRNTLLLIEEGTENRGQRAKALRPRK